MPGFTPNATVAQVVMRYLQDNQQVENVWWFQGDATYDIATLQALADAMIGWENDSVIDARCNNVSLQSVVATDWSTEAGVQYIDVPAVIPVGEQTDPMPNHVTVAIAHRTNLRGRSFRGRHYFIGLPHGDTLDNTVTEAFVAFIIGAYGGVADAVGAINGSKHVVYSQFADNVRRTTGVATPVTHYTCEQFIDSQRRRLPGHNRHR